MSMLRSALLSLPLLVMACDPGDEAGSVVGEGLPIEARCVGCDWGPPMTNTHGLNGLPVAALDTTGLKHDGWELLSVHVVIDSLPDHPVHDVYVEDGILYGTDDDDQLFAGADFVGSAWTVGVDTPNKGYEIMVMRISEFIADGPRSRYSFNLGHTLDDPEGFTCDEDPETGERTAILFRDLDVDAATGTHTERAKTIYFGCISGSVGKAAMWGYSPWNTDDQMHQTATRVVRADYCGDGTSYTLQGTGLQVRDDIGLRGDFERVEEPTEAMWGPNGALCLLNPRLDDYVGTTIACNGQPLPICGANDEFSHWPTALLWTKDWPSYWLAK